MMRINTTLFICIFVIFIIILFVQHNAIAQPTDSCNVELQRKLIQENRLLLKEIAILQRKNESLLSTTQSEVQRTQTIRSEQTEIINIQQQQQQQQQQIPIFVDRKEISNAVRSTIDNSCIKQLKSLKINLEKAIKSGNKMNISYYRWRYKRQASRCVKEKQQYK